MRNEEQKKTATQDGRAISVAVFSAFMRFKK